MQKGKFKVPLFTGRKRASGICGEENGLDNLAIDWFARSLTQYSSPQILPAVISIYGLNTASSYKLCSKITFQMCVFSIIANTDDLINNTDQQYILW